MTLKQLLIMSDAVRVVGIILVAIVALSAHFRVYNVQALDDAVARGMARERRYAIAGIVLIAASYLMNAYAYVKF